MMKEKRWDVIATIFVGLMSALIAWEANKIGDLQAQIAVTSSLPNIQVNERQVFDEEEGQVVASTIEISNLEGRLSNFNASIVTVVNFVYSEIGKEYYCVDIPIKSYYIINEISGVNNGVIEKKNSMDNFLKLWELRKEVRERCTSDDVIMIVDQPISYIKITYDDLLGNGREEYYCSNAIKTYHLDETVGEEKYQLYANMIDAGYYIDPNWTDQIDVDNFCDLAHRISELDNEFQYENNDSFYKGDGIKMTWDILDVIGVIIALLSFFVAVRAMKLQHKSIVYNNRLEIYTEVERLYKKCICIVQKSKTIKNVYSRKIFIASCMYGMGDEEYRVVTDAVEKEKKSKNKKSKVKALLQEDWVRLLGTYSDLYIKKYLDNDIESKMNLFFSEKLAKSVMKVYNCYDELRLGIILFEEEELDERMDQLQESIEEFEKCKVLKKMKRKLPVR